MKVYLVLAGEYSGQYVPAVFENRHHADALIEQMKEWDAANKDQYMYHYRSARVEEYDLTTVVPVLHPWKCYMDETGTVVWVDTTELPGVSASPGIDRSGYTPKRVYAYGTTKEHAITNCADFLRAWLATHGNPPSCRQTI